MSPTGIFLTLLCLMVVFLIWYKNSSRARTAGFCLPSKNNEDWVVLDTETTGLSKSSEIIEVAVASSNGKLLFHSYVKPIGRIPREASDIHGITRDRLKNAPHWPDVQDKLAEVLQGRLVYCYNAEFDSRLLNQTAKKWGIPLLDTDIECAMLIYAALRGEKHPYRAGEFKWHKLTKACQHEGLTIKNAHSAYGDAQMTAALLIHAISKYK